MNEDQEVIQVGGEGLWFKVKRYFKKEKKPLITPEEPTFHRDDLNPTPSELKTWNTIHYVALWIAMVINLPSYMIGASLFSLGLNWYLVLIVVIIGNFILCAPMILNAHVGAKYGIPFPVFIRLMFGYHGAKLVGLIRGVVSIMWFSVQTWIGGESIYYIILAIDYRVAKAPYVDWIGINIVQFACFVLFWQMNLFVIYNGTESIKWLEVIISPVLCAMTIALFAWAWIAVGSFTDILNATDELAAKSNVPVYQALLLGTTVVIGTWSTLSLNTTDFSRFASSQRAQILGQLLGMPLSSIILACIGCFVTAASEILYGTPLWNPIHLVAKWDNLPVTIIALLSFVLATLSTNVAANVVSAANCLTNLSPKIISYRAGIVFTAIACYFIFPWKIIESPDVFLNKVIVLCSILFGALTGIMICDYWIIRRTNIEVPPLYSEDGINVKWEGICSFFLSIAPLLPAVFHKWFGLYVDQWLIYLYDVAWFVTTCFGIVTYWILFKLKEKCISIKLRKDTSDNSVEMEWDEELKVVKFKGKKTSYDVI